MEDDEALPASLPDPSHRSKPTMELYSSHTLHSNYITTAKHHSIRTILCQSKMAMESPKLTIDFPIKLSIYIYIYSGFSIAMFDCQKMPEGIFHHISIIETPSAPDFLAPGTTNCSVFVGYPALVPRRRSHVGSGPSSSQLRASRSLRKSETIEVTERSE